MSGVNTPSNEIDVYRVNAVLGDRLRWSLASEISYDMNVRVYDPTGQHVPGSQFTIEMSGSYTIVVQRYYWSSNPQPYNLFLTQIGHVESTAPAGTTINLDVPQSGSLTPEVSLAFEFVVDSANNQGKLIYLQASGLSVQWQLYGSQRNQRISVGNGGNFQPMLLADGEYTLVLTSTDEVPVSYAFELQDLSVATLLDPLNPVSTALTSTDRQHVYRMHVEAGQDFFFDFYNYLEQHEHVLEFRMLDSRGREVNFDWQPAEYTEDYTLVVSADPMAFSYYGLSEVPYAVRFAPISVSEGSLNVGDQRTGTISTPGERDRYAFTLGSTTLLDVDGLIGDAFSWVIRDEDGVVVRESYSLGYPYNVFELSQGSYTIEIASYDNGATGAYSFRLANLANAPTLPAGTVSGSLDPVTSSRAYRFHAEAGDRYSFDALTGTGITWALYSSLGRQLAYADNFEDLPTLALREAGDYFLVIEGHSESPTPADFSFNTVFGGNAPVPPNTAALIEVGTVVNGRLIQVAHQRRFDLSVTQAGSYLLDVPEADYSFVWKLLDSEGAVIWTPDMSSVLDLGVGEYSLVIDGGDGNLSPGYIAFRFLSLVNSQEIVVDDDAEAMAPIDQANPARVFHFTAQEGEQLSLTFDSWSSYSNTYWLIGPNGDLIAGPAGYPYTNTVVLPGSGEYKLVVGDRSPNNVYATTLIVGLSKTPAPVARTLAVGQIININNQGPEGTPGSYVLTLDAPRQLLLDVISYNQYAGQTFTIYDEDDNPVYPNGSWFYTGGLFSIRRF